MRELRWIRFHAEPVLRARAAEIGDAAMAVAFSVLVGAEYAWLRLRGQTPWFVVKGQGR